MNNINKNLQNPYQEEELEFLTLFNIFKRNFRFITLITSAATISTILISYFIKPIYKGSFEIIVESNEAPKTNPYNSDSFLDLTSLASGIPNLKTQEVVLRSPSVLLPVFDFVKKNDPSINGKDNLDYQSWTNKNLNISFKKGTNVLTISYQNHEKDFIINVLNRISKKYKEFSKSDKEKTLNKTIEYLNNQQKVYFEKARLSRKELNLFAIENGLGDIDGFVDLENTVNNSSFEFEKSVDSDFIKSFKNSSSSVNKSSQEAGQRFKNQFRILEGYEAEYTNLSSVLKENSQVLKVLKRKIENLRNALKRPNEILLKYRELRNIANRDEQILNSIENKYAMFQLEKFKQLDAWKMISQPTIDKNRVSPQRTKLTLSALLLGFLLSYLIAFYKEQKKGIIFELKQIKSRINCNYLESIYIDEIQLSQKIISSILNLYEDSKIGLVDCSEVEAEIEDLSKSKIQTFLNKFPIAKINDEKQINFFDKLIILVNEEKFNNKQLIILNKYIKIYQSKVIGFIYVCNLN